MFSMPWDMNDYPDSMKNMDKVVRKKAIDIGNALLDNGYSEDRAIPIAQQQAKEWVENASKDEKNSFEKEANPKKSDKHDKTSDPDLLDNDVKVFYEEDKWKVQTVEADRPDSTYDKKSEALDRAKQIAENKESSVITYTKDGKKQDS